VSERDQAKSAISMLHVDNQAAIAQIEGDDTSRRATHIDTRHKFVKDFAKMNFGRQMMLSS
jgi:hypothetical protein